MALIVLDSSVVIGFLDASDGHHEAAVTALREARADQLVIPASGYAEILVGPSRRGPAAVAIVDEVLSDFAVHIEPVSAAIARRAAALRARHAALRLPDALVMATADVLDASRILTADRAWRRWSRRVQTI